MYQCEIIADSVSPTGKRITTFQITFPRIVLAEFNTHRMLSRNSASSRAIPIERMIHLVKTDPYIPVFTKNQAGMQGIDATTDQEFQDEAHNAWLEARDHAVEAAKTLSGLGVHKQEANRLLEPFMWHTVVCTATEWQNFFALRCHPMAHPAIQTIAYHMRDQYNSHTPTLADWHLPYIAERDVENMEEWVYSTPERTSVWLTDKPLLLARMSAARCARVSYLRHQTVKDIDEDLALFDRLVGPDPKHVSPTEHQARALWSNDLGSGNFYGWEQFRHMIAGESVKG